MLSVMTTVVEIEQAALSLPERQRARLAESLLQSLPPDGVELTEALEIEEVERRDREIATGLVHPLSDSEFWRRVEAGRKL